MMQVGNGEVTLEDGLRIDLNLVAFTPQHGLLLSGLVLSTQETLAVRERLLIDSGCRRAAPFGIELQRDGGLAQLQRARDGSGKRRKIGASHVPVTQLPGDEFVDHSAIVHVLSF